MLTIQEITTYLEQLAPLQLQEDYDNAGLIIGNAHEKVTGVLVSLDCTEAVIQEAIDRSCNLVVAHHPIVFKGLKKITGRNYIERTVLMAIKNNIAIYAIHTNLDNVVGGVNFKIAAQLGLQNVSILSPKASQLMKLVVFTPVAHTESLLRALHAAGAGDIGNYSNCSFHTTGTGSFMPNQAANPTIGQANVQEEVLENRIEVVFPSYLQGKILTAMKAAHVYEEVAYYVSAINNQHQAVGSGAVGFLENEMNEVDFLQFLKEKMNVTVIRHTALLNKKIKKVALCGGAGGFLLNAAIGQKADIFITADYKYHEFFDADGHLIIADIGHFESEQYTKELLVEYLSKKITNFAVCLSKVATNPIHYF